MSNVTIFGSLRHLDFDYPEFQEFLFNILFKVEVPREVNWYKGRLLRKMRLKFLTRWIEHLTSQEVGGRESFVSTSCILGECNCCCIL